jgi:hypothetical protein
LYIYHGLSCIHHHNIPRFSVFLFSPVIFSITSIMQVFFYLITYPVLYHFPCNFVLYSLAKLGASNFLDPIFFFHIYPLVFSVFSINISFLLKSDQNDSLVLALIEHR